MSAFEFLFSFYGLLLGRTLTVALAANLCLVSIGCCADAPAAGMKRG